MNLKQGLVSIFYASGNDDKASDYKVTGVTLHIVRSSAVTVFIEAIIERLG